MKQYKNLLLSAQKVFSSLILFLLLSTTSFSQITITGIDGLTFNNTGSDYTISITNNFTLHSMKVEPDGLSLSWNQSENKFTIYGGLKLTVESDILNVNLGSSTSPGLIITNGELLSVSLGITADFTLKAITFKPQDLTFQWNKSSNEYEMFGDVTVNLEEDQISATFGDVTTPGITIENGSVQELNISLSADFVLKTLSFHAKDASFYWIRSDNKYVMHGSFTLDVESDDVEVTMGDSDDPGLIIIGGQINQLILSITADFEMKGLSVEVEGMGIKWWRETPREFFGFHGDAKLNIDNQSIDVNFGDTNHPGLLFENSAVSEINISVNSDFKIGNLSLETNDLTLSYKSNIYKLTGTMTITDIWTLEVDLGSGSNSGIEVDVSGDSDSFVLESLTITLENASLGSVDFKEIQLKFADDRLQDAKMIASFPPSWEVQGEIQFTTGDQASINSISLDWETDNIDDAIEIPGTGMAVVYISGDFGNLDNTSDLYFTGAVGLTFGGPFEVDGYELTFIYIESDIEITHYKLEIDTDIDVGAYKHDGDWHSLLGDGDLDITLIWNEKYTIDGKFKIPTDPMIEADLTASISASKSLDALLDVEFIVPSWVPFIHGKHFGSADGAIRYINGHPTDSYAAGWVKVDTWIDDFYIGAKYNMGTKDITKLGHSDIDKIKDEIEGSSINREGLPYNKSTTGYTQIIKSFELEPETSTMVMINLDWDSIIDTAYVTVMGPDGIMNLVELVVDDDGDSTSVPVITSAENLTFVEADNQIDFFIVPASSLSETKTAVKASLTPGLYQVFFSYNAASASIDSLNITASKFFPLPHGSISSSAAANSSIDLDMGYWAYLPDSTSISIYVNDTANYNGRLIEHIPFGTVIDDDSGSAAINYSVTNMNVGNSVYFYIVVDDGVNIPFYSDFTEPIIYYPPIYGSVTLLDSVGLVDSAHQGFTVYIDESGNDKFDTESTGGLEPNCVTNKDGEFEFHSLVSSTYPINIVLPSGFVLDAASPSPLPASLTYNGTPLQINFIIRREN